MAPTNDKEWKVKIWKDVVAIDVRYKDKERTRPEICIWRRTQAGKTMHTDPDLFPSYFYIPKYHSEKIDELDPDSRPTNIEFPEHKALNGATVVRLNYYAIEKNHFRSITEKFPITFEADVKYPIRYMLDNEIQFNPNRRILFIDIENEMCLDTENTPGKVLSIATFDSFTQESTVLVLDEECEEKRKVDEMDGSVIVSFKSELDMLEKFVKYVQLHNPDILCAYNLNAFDFPYLINRMKKMQIDFRNLSEIRSVYTIVDPLDASATKCHCGGRELIDWYLLMKKLYDEDKPENYKLDTVGEKILGMKKVTHQYKNLMELYKKDRKLFLQYNIQDVTILNELEKKIGFIGKYLTSVQQLIPMPLAMLPANSIALDFHILKTYNKKKVFPSKVKREKVKFSGALTGKFTEVNGEIVSVAPEKKMFKNIGVLDFSGMYANIIRTFNISPETVCIPGEPDSISIGTTGFDQSKQGVIPALIADIVKLRKLYSSELENLDPNSPKYAIVYNLQSGIKRIGNSVYGTMGYSGFRLYDPKVAESVTLLGQSLIKEVFKFLRDKLGYNTIYQDTDSVFIPLRCQIEDKEATTSEIEKIEFEVNKMIGEFVIKMGAPTNYMMMDFEKRFTTVVFLGVKKRYMGNADLWKGKWLPKQKVVIKGVDLVRREMAPITKEIVKTIVMGILNGVKYEELRDYYRASVKKIKTTPIKEIAWARGLGKNIEEYKKTTPQHVKACLAAKQYLGLDFRMGDTVKLMYVRDMPYINAKGIASTTDVIGFEKDTVLPDKILTRIDYDRYIESFIQNKLKMFFGVEGMNMEMILSNHIGLDTWLVPNAAPDTFKVSQIINELDLTMTPEEEIDEELMEQTGEHTCD